MDFLYAELNGDHVCIGISQLSGPVESDYLIPLSAEEFSEDLIMRKYENGVWGDKIIIDPQDPPPTVAEQLWDAIDAQANVLEIILEVAEN